jgi:hypothetical protein
MLQKERLSSYSCSTRSSDGGCPSEPRCKLAGAAVVARHYLSWKLRHAWHPLRLISAVTPAVWTSRSSSHALRVLTTSLIASELGESCGKGRRGPQGRSRGQLTPGSTYGKDHNSGGPGTGDSW